MRADAASIACFDGLMTFSAAKKLMKSTMFDGNSCFGPASFPVDVGQHEMWSTSQGVIFV